jgi:hypothetical protein
MKTITRESVMNYWVNQLNSQKETYKDDCNEWNTTYMGEQAAEHFGIMSEEGNSPLEQDIFDWAVEFSINN